MVLSVINTKYTVLHHLNMRKKHNQQFKLLECWHLNQIKARLKACIVDKCRKSKNKMLYALIENNDIDM